MNETLCIENVRNYMLMIDELLKAGQRLLLEGFSNNNIVAKKGKRDFTLKADLELERFYKKKLSAFCPEIPIIGEELSPDVVKLDYNGFFWTIDPVDGTVNYYRNLPEYGSSIALIYNGRPIASGVCFPAFNEVYLAGVGMGAFLNSKKINVSNKDNLDASIMAFGDFSVTEDSLPENIYRRKFMEAFSDQVLRIRMPGSAALQLAWLASGRIDISVTLSNASWDVQGGVLLVREAGGNVYDIDGRDHCVLSKYTIASNLNIRDEVIRLIDEIITV